MTHYDTLGITKDADATAIKKAYKSLASKNHPDKGGDTKKFQDINTAYQILSDEQKKVQYDAEISGGGGRQFHFNSSSGMDPDLDLGDIFNQMRSQFGFGAGTQDPFAQFKQANQNRVVKNKDIRISIQIPLVDTLTEHNKVIALTLPGNMKETMNIRVPRGITNGTTIRYPGLGDYSIPKAPRADLYVQFHLKPEYNYEPAGIDLVTHLVINCLEAITGCEKQVKGIDDKLFALTIPPGVQVGTKFGINEQGLYAQDHPGRGRLIVQIDVYIPKDLTEGQLALIKQINANL
jgi:DnaJ-class molecular chaperone